MNSSIWERFSGIGQAFSGLFRGAGLLQKGRQSLAETVRQAAVGIRSVFATYLGLLVLLGMVTAGFVLLPAGLMFIGDSLLSRAVDRPLVGGVFLCLVGLFYLVVPLIAIRLVSQVVLGRIQRKAERLADRIEGR